MPIDTTGRQTVIIRAFSSDPHGLQKPLTPSPGWGSGGREGTPRARMPDQPAAGGVGCLSPQTERNGHPLLPVGKQPPPPAAPPDVDLPGGRKARVIPADQAGQTRLHIVDGDWIDRLHMRGLIDDDQRAASVVLVALFEECGIRQSTAGRYDGVFIDGHGAIGSPLERMNAAELRAWRKLHRLLRHAPRFSRGEVHAVCLVGLKPVSITRLRAGLSAIAAALR